MKVRIRHMMCGNSKSQNPSSKQSQMTKIQNKGERDQYGCKAWLYVKEFFNDAIKRQTIRAAMPYNVQRYYPIVSLTIFSFSSAGRSPSTLITWASRK
ncbi:hypothetical protein ES705_14768 [subsurface metagenome]